MIRQCNAMCAVYHPFIIVGEGLLQLSYLTLYVHGNNIQWKWGEGKKRCQIATARKGNGKAGKTPAKVRKEIFKMLPCRDSVRGFWLQVFFKNRLRPALLIFLIVPFRIFSKIRQDICSSSCTTSTKDSCSKWTNILNRWFIFCLHTTG